MSCASQVVAEVEVSEHNIIMIIIIIIFTTAHQAEPLKAVCPLSFSAPPLLGTLKCDGAMQCKTQQSNAVSSYAMLCTGVHPYVKQ